MWKRKDDWIGSQVDDQYVMIHLDSGRYMALNQTAAAAWQVLETPSDSGTLVAALMERFKVDEQQCARSVDAMLEGMIRLDLVERVDEQSVSTSR